MTTEKRILVTGGAGYLGSAVTTMLLGRGRRVVVLDDLTYGTAGLDGVLDDPRLELIRADVRDRDAVRSAVRDVEAVFHLAAIANDPSGDLDTALTRSINLDAYTPLLEEARAAGARLFVNASSFSVYGVNVTPNITETDPLNCRREYSRCKAESEAVVRSFTTDAFATVSIRLATMCSWSPRMRFDVIANQLLGIAQVERKVVVHGGEQQRPHIDIRDVCDLFEVLLDAPPERYSGEVFNAGGENVTIRQLAELARDIVGQDGGEPVELTYAPGRADERSYHVNSDKLERVLGFRAKRTIRESMQSIADAHARGEWSDPHADEYHNIRRLANRLDAAAVG
ncbi:NAD-dependent epimerase/dehydratase family protein [Actinomycetes bacterium KLBMP 9759]